MCYNTCLSGSPDSSLGKFRSNPYIHNSVYVQQQTFQKEVKYFLLTAIHIEHIKIFEHQFIHNLFL